MIATIQHFLSPIWSYKRISYTLFFHYLFIAIEGSLLVYFNSQIIAAVERGDQTMLMTNVWYIIILGGAIFCSSLFFGKLYDIVFSRMTLVLQKKYMKQAIYLDNNAYETLGTGYFSSVFTSGIASWSGLIREVLTNGVNALFTICFSFILIYLGAGRYGVFYTSIGAVGVLFLMIRGHYKSLPMKHKKRTTMGVLHKQFVRIIMSKYDILFHNKRDQEIRRVSRLWQDMIDHEKEELKRLFFSYDIPYFFEKVVRIVVYVYVGLGIFDNRYTIADLILLITVLELLKTAINSISGVYKSFATEFLYVTRLQHLFTTIQPMQGIDEGVPFVIGDANISIQNMSYAYSTIDAIQSVESSKKTTIGETAVFNNISLDIAGGKKTALVGPSGSGKSTLIKLIAGYVRPTQGSILVDGQDIQDASLLSYYPHVGYLTQDPSVFDGTIYDNLTYAIDYEIDESTVHEAIRMAQCQFIYELPQGRDTAIGERGVRLSGGERQRLAIAKIIIKDPAIVLLDEPTSALDSFSEEAISQAMHHLFAGRTVITIAHRLQTVKDADDIIYIQDGQVVERGTHDELLAQNGAYARMLELQSAF